jgi:hypothetical protein
MTGKRMTVADFGAMKGKRQLTMLCTMRLEEGPRQGKGSGSTSSPFRRTDPQYRDAANAVARGTPAAATSLNI